MNQFIIGVFLASPHQMIEFRPESLNEAKSLLSLFEFCTSVQDDVDLIESNGYVDIELHIDDWKRFNSKHSELIRIHLNRELDQIKQELYNFQMGPRTENTVESAIQYLKKRKNDILYMLNS